MDFMTGRSDRDGARRRGRWKPNLRRDPLGSPWRICGGLLLLLGLVLGATAAPALAQDPAATEYSIKAAYLYNIARFVTWPDSSFHGPDDPFVIVVVGTDPFGPEFDELLAGRTIDGRGVRIERLKAEARLPRCHLVFLTQSAAGNLGAMLAYTAGKAILTTSDAAGFTSRGGMFEFYLDGDNVRFQINPAAASQAGLAVSAKLLGMAKLVPNAPAGNQPAASGGER